jgi:hypothetical protein
MLITCHFMDALMFFPGMPLALLRHQELKSRRILILWNVPSLGCIMFNEPVF